MTVPLSLALAFIGSAIFGLALAGAGVVLIQRQEFRRREEVIRAKHREEMNELRALLQRAQDEIVHLKGVVAGLAASNQAIIRHINNGDIVIEAGEDIHIGEFTGRDRASTRTTTHNSR